MRILEAIPGSVCRLVGNNSIEKAKRYIEQVCIKQKISINELKSGSRRKCISETRWQIAVRLVEEYGFSMAEAARLLGVTTSGIFKIMKRIENQ